MRIVKEAEERRNEILDACEKLFGLNGFDNTSTNDILNEVGIARGTLYYHFKSKEDILDAMIERITSRLTAQAARIAADSSIPVMQRLPMTIMSLNMDNSLGSEIVNQVHKPQNALMHRKMQQTLLTAVNPIVAKLIKEGTEQGIWSTDYPDELTEMAMLYSNTAFDDLACLSEEQRVQKVNGFIYNVERLLGVEEGSMKSVLMPLFGGDD